MAPTEVLAEQHHLGVRGLLGELSRPDPATLSGERPLRVELLTHRTTAAERRRLARALADGDVDVLIGTHALIQEGVTFGRLGVTVIDEQHRFGVEQRAALRDRSGEDGATPDVLVMTATPIPRTAAMTVYGDLDVSVLDELPPGRTPVHTAWVTEEAEVWPQVRDGGRRRPPGLRGHAADRGVREDRDRLGRGDVRPPHRPGRRAGRPGRRPAARPAAAARQGRHHGAVPAGRARRAGRHDGHRGGRGRAQRHDHGRARRRPLRHRPAPPAAGPGGPGRRRLDLLPRVRGPTAQAEARLSALVAPAPTASSWPRSTSSCGARARSWASGRPAATTSSWPRSAGTASGWAGPGRPPSRWSTSAPCAARPALADEVELFLGTADTDFLLKS